MLSSNSNSFCWWASIQDEEGYTAVNLLACCDSRGLFTYANSRYPGCCHDSFVFQQSSLYNCFYLNKIPPGYSILGDSGFSNSNFLITPYTANNANPQQLRFNKAHKRTRVVIEQSFGVLKRRFAILKSLRVEPIFASKVIISCCCLHNLFILCRWSTMRVYGNRISRMPFPGNNVPDMRNFMAANIWFFPIISFSYFYSSYS